MKKTEQEMIEKYPFLSNYKISGQDEAGCAEACLVAAKAILCGKDISSRKEFLVDLNKIYLNRLRNNNSFGPLDIPSLKIHAQDMNLDAQVKNLSNLEHLVQSGSLMLVRLSWAKFDKNNEIHRYIDDEHYVLVYGSVDETIFFWEPSFSYNGKNKFTEQRNQNSKIPGHLSYSSPFWSMPKEEFIQRVEQTITLPLSKGEALILKHNNFTQV